MMSPTKKIWTRAVEKTGKFPENKYGFIHHLKNVGDFIVSHPMPLKDFNKIKYAAYSWAYEHKCRIITRRIRTSDDMYKIYIRLSNLNRVRGFT